MPNLSTDNSQGGHSPPAVQEKDEVQHVGTSPVTEENEADRLDCKTVKDQVSREGITILDEQKTEQGIGIPSVGVENDVKKMSDEPGQDTKIVEERNLVEADHGVSRADDEKSKPIMAFPVEENKILPDKEAPSVTDDNCTLDMNIEVNEKQIDVEKNSPTSVIVGDSIPTTKVIIEENKIKEGKEVSRVSDKESRTGVITKIDEKQIEGANEATMISLDEKNPAKHVKIEDKPIVVENKDDELSNRDKCQEIDKTSLKSPSKVQRGREHNESEIRPLKQQVEITKNLENEVADTLQQVVAKKIQREISKEHEDLSSTAKVKEESEPISFIERKSEDAEYSKFEQSTRGLEIENRSRDNDGRDLKKTESQDELASESKVEMSATMKPKLVEGAKKAVESVSSSRKGQTIITIKSAPTLESDGKSRTDQECDEKTNELEETQKKSRIRNR